MEPAKRIAPGCVHWGDARLGCLAFMFILAGCSSSSGDSGNSVSADAPAAAATQTSSTALPVTPVSTGPAPTSGASQDSSSSAALDTVAASQQAAATSTLRDCGNEGELVCGLFERDAWNSTCDTGLTSRLETCGCLLRGLFGNCLIPKPCRICRNETRHRPETTNLYASSWVAWALRNQRDELAVDEPVNWVMRLGTHNAFNSVSDGHRPRVALSRAFPLLSLIGLAAQVADAPNHFYSMTDQLNIGSRALAVDAHWADDNARLCHSFKWEDQPTVEALICMVPDVLGLDGVFPSMRYFANGIKEIRNWLANHPGEIIILDLENYVGCTNGCSFGDSAHIADPLRTYLGSWLLPNTIASGAPFPSRAELLAMGKRVVFVTNGPIGDAFDYDEGQVVSGVFPLWTRNNQDLDACRDTLNDPNNVGGPAVLDDLGERGKFSLIVDDRTLQRFFIEILGQDPFGEISEDDIRKAVKCNYSFIFSDFLGSSLPLGRQLDLPDFGRHEAAVWSWRVGDRGDQGDCALLEAITGRWASADCAASRHYACAPPRSESGTEDRSGWDQFEKRWKITTASGPWEGGPAACDAEFPFNAAENTHYVFSVPVSGYQNERLKEANVGAHDLWLNFTDQAREGRWLIPRLADLNAPPVADAGPDQELECGEEAVLDGSASFDPDEDPLTYEWSGPFGTLPGPVVSVTLGGGVHTVTLTVQDGKGGVDGDSTTITVLDTEPPTLSVTVSPRELWPPNHEMVNVVADARATDNCGAEDVVIELVSVVSDEPENAQGDGNTAPDIQDAEIGIGDLELALRAERSGKNSGRTYTLTYRATDKAGNSTETRADVRVAHDGRP